MRGVYDAAIDFGIPSGLPSRIVSLCDGVGRLAEQWAYNMRVPIQQFHAGIGDDLSGNTDLRMRRGPIWDVIKETDALVIIWNAEGDPDLLTMVQIARELKKPYLIYNALYRRLEKA
jgi:hypothetical protein